MNASLPPFYQQNPLQRFSDRAADYAQYRPVYPPEAIAAILDNLGDPSTLVAADVGAGTGISARLLADWGVQVLALEPNAQMRQTARPHPRVQMVSATAEQTGLADSSVDLIVCAQAFHWFEPEASLAEFHRILKPSGRLALMWNSRDQNDAFTRQFTDILRRGSDQQFFIRRDRKSPEALARSSLFGNFRQLSFANRHRLDRDGLIGLALSASYVLKTGESYGALRVELEDLYQRWANTGRADIAPPGVAVMYQTGLYLAEACPPG